jgi:hypothetical protein
VVITLELLLLLYCWGNHFEVWIVIAGSLFWTHLEVLQHDDIGSIGASGG